MPALAARTSRLRNDFSTGLLSAPESPKPEILNLMVVARAPGTSLLPQIGHREAPKGSFRAKHPVPRLVLNRRADTQRYRRPGTALGELNVRGFAALGPPTSTAAAFRNHPNLR